MLIAAKANDTRAIERLTSKHGADVNCKGWASEQTPLHKAAANGHEALVEKLLLMGANMNAKDLFGWTPVMLAAKNRHYTIAQRLLARGCYANERDDNQNSAIHIAVTNGSQRMLDLLIANGGNVNFANRHRQTALHLATQNGHRTLVYVLLKNKHLLVNAVSFAQPEGEVHVRLSAEQDSAILVITDSGPGIPAEHLDRVFDRFFTTRGERAGSGLGLAMVHAVVLAHGGQVIAASAPQGGAMMTVRLPLSLG